MGWKTLDHYENTEKNFNQFLCVCGLSCYRQLSTLLELWEPSYPKLHILCGPKYLESLKISKKEQDNITYQEEYIAPGKFSKLLNSYGFHLCLSSTSSYSNTLQNCLSAKSIPIAMDNVLNRSFITHQKTGFLIKTKKRRNSKIIMEVNIFLMRKIFKTLFLDTKYRRNRIRRNSGKRKKNID